MVGKVVSCWIRDDGTLCLRVDYSKWHGNSLLAYVQFGHANPGGKTLFDSILGHHIAPYPPPPSPQTMLELIFNIEYQHCSWGEVGKRVSQRLLSNIVLRLGEGTPGKQVFRSGVLAEMLT